MRARGLGGTEIPVHVEDDDITNERRRSGRDIAHLKLIETERPWFDTAHFSHLSPFLVSPRQERFTWLHARWSPLEPSARAPGTSGTLVIPDSVVPSRLLMLRLQAGPSSRHASAVFNTSIACRTAARVAGVPASGFSITKSWIVSL